MSAGCWYNNPMFADKIKNLSKHPYYRMLSDTRSLGLLAFGVVALLVTWSGVKAVQTNYELQKQIAGLEQSNDVSKLENDNQRLRNEYYNSDEFLELAARRQFGKALPGETLYLVPKNVALAHAPSLAAAKQQPNNNKSQTHKPTWQKNFEAWINFYLHRTQ